MKRMHIEGDDVPLFEEDISFKEIINTFFNNLKRGKTMENISNIATKEAAKKYSFETVFWMVAWLQFVSFAIISLIEYFTAVGLIWNVPQATSLVISLLKGFNIIVIGAMIKFFTNVMDAKNAENIQLRDEKEEITTKLAKKEEEAKAVKKECSDAEAELMALKVEKYGEKKEKEM
jgi:hypothetical protein